MEWEAKEELLNFIKKMMKDEKIEKGYINSLSIEDINYIEDEECIYIYEIGRDYNCDGLEIEKEILSN